MRFLHAITSKTQTSASPSSIIDYNKQTRMTSLGGMFLATELGNEQELPSFFEVFMQDRINQSLKPAVRHIVVVLAERFPRAILLLERFDEVFACLSYFLERHYLRGDALLAESLYGFRRSVYVDGQMKQLGPIDRQKALALNVLAPYCKAKLDNLFSRWSTNPPRGSGPRTQLRKAFLAMYPILHASYEGSFFIYQWAYLLGHTKHYSPLLHLLGMVLRRITREDLEKPKTGEQKANRKENIIVRYIKIALVLAIIAFKVLEWWVSTPDDLLAPRKRIAPPVPDPPEPALTGIPLPKDPLLCPLCQEHRVNPAISSAGIAFCYRCLVNHVREHGTCPVTLQNCREEQNYRGEQVRICRDR